MSNLSDQSKQLMVLDHIIAEAKEKLTGDAVHDYALQLTITEAEAKKKDITNSSISHLIGEEGKIDLGPFMDLLNE
jgi:hypothetical protein